ncbi:glycosyltransferase family 2 protein [Streptococcus hongkongensis]|nr:hypothetical protein NC01_08275 [Streptococcus uberis]
MKEKDELISVIVPIYNVADFVRECLQSIVKQTYENIEIILVNDGSTDNSMEIISDIIQKDNRISVINKTNGGLSDARNHGILKSKGSYITFIDSDDFVDPTYIEILYNLIKKYNSDISIVNMKEYQNGKIKHFSKNCYEKIFITDDILQAMYKRNDYYSVILTVAQSKLYKRELFDSLLFPLGKKYEDSFTTYKLYLQSSKIIFKNIALYYYRIREGSIINSAFNLSNLDKIEMFEERIKLLSSLQKDTSRDEVAYAIELYRTKYFLKQNHFENEIQTIDRKAKLMYKQLIKQANIPFKYKLKLFLVKSFPRIIQFSR